MREHTKRVLQQLKENDLFLKLEKCKFITKEVEFLGMIVKEGKIMMDPVKLAGISKWPEPKTVNQVWSFLGFAGFTGVHRKLCWNYGSTHEPNEENGSIPMGCRVPKSVWHGEGKVLGRTCINYARSGETIYFINWCIKLGSRSCPKTERIWRRTTPMQIYQSLA